MPAADPGKTMGPAPSPRPDAITTGAAPCLGRGRSATILTMLAAVLRGPRSLDLASVPTPTPGPTDAVIRVKAAGLCGTDYRIWTGERPVQYPRVMGHEFVGTVAAVGAEVGTLTVGQTVAVEPNYSCGVCPLCREGNRNLCLSRVAVGIGINSDGGNAEAPRRLDDAAGNFSPVRNENLLKHGLHF